LDQNDVNRIHGMPSGGVQSAQTELNNNRAMWAASRIKDYNYTHYQGGMVKLPPVNIQVRNNQVVSAVYSDTQRPERWRPEDAASCFCHFQTELRRIRSDGCPGTEWLPCDSGRQKPG